MTQLSRPLQVALAAAGLLVVVWFVALRGHSSNAEPTATTSTHAASSSAGASGGSSTGSKSVYHGSAPGVEGLTRDVQKARGAVTQSEQNAAQLEQKSAQASGDGTAASSGATSSAASSAARATHSSSASSVTKVSKHASTNSRPSTTPHKSAARTHAAGGTAGQVWVERELGQKMTVALLFYTPHAYTDSRTRRELERLIGQERGYHVKIVLRVASADQVGTYGSFTRVASIYQTPTLLVISRTGEVKPPITGLTDAFAIEQALDEKTQP